MVCQLLAVGLISILGQVVLLRELYVACFGSELIYILAFGFWLFGTAIGTVSGRRAFKPSSAIVTRLLYLSCLLLPLLMLLSRRLRLIFGAVQGAYLEFVPQLIAIAMVVFPLSWLLGLLLQWTVKQYVATGHSLARGYAVESMGGLLGGALATVFLSMGVSNCAAGMICGLLGVATATLPILLAQRIERALESRPTFISLSTSGSQPEPNNKHHLSGPNIVSVITVIALLMLGLVFSQELDLATTAWNHPQLLTTVDTPYGRATVTGNSGQVSVFSNDMLIADSEGIAAEEFVHLSAVHHPDPQKVLLLGGGTEGLLGKLLEHGPDYIDHVELDGALHGILPRWLPDYQKAGEAAAVVHRSVTDPRRFLNRFAGALALPAGSADSVAYDLILSAMPEPSSGQTNRYYTQEFFQQCADCLSPDGILAFRLQTGENFWTTLDAQRAASIYNALRVSFSEIVVLPSSTNLVLASRQPFTLTVAELAGHLRDRQISARLVGPEYINHLYNNDRFAMNRERLDQVAAVTGVNTDLHPICYRYTLQLWLGQFFPHLISYDSITLVSPDWWRGPWSWLMLAVLLLTGWFVRHRMSSRRVLLAFTAGLTGMISETVLVLAYQAGSGVLYRDLGLLLMLFMFGLAAGSLVVDHWNRRRLDVRNSGVSVTRRESEPSLFDVRNKVGLGKYSVATTLLLTMAMGWSLLVWWLLNLGRAQGLVVDMLLLAGCGFFTATLFGYAGCYGHPELQQTISPLLGADLLGGCVGSLLVILLLIPVAGLPGTMLVVAGIFAVMLFYC